MARTITLPRPDGTLETYTPGAPSPYPQTAGPIRSRIGFAAVHVVANPLANNDPWLDTDVDWDTTLAYRRYVFRLADHAHVLRDPDRAAERMRRALAVVGVE